MSELFVSLRSVFTYLKASPESRCVVEGEEILNANHIILIGSTTVSHLSVEILGLCLQTSALKNNPHEIKGIFEFIKSTIEIRDFKCTCKAGMSGVCKHISAVLLKCTRSNISSLEKLSSTDIKCYWANKKKKVEVDYEAKPLLETSCFLSRLSRESPLTADQQQTCFQALTAACEESSLSLHLKGRPSTSTIDSNILVIPTNIKCTLSNAENSEFLANLNIMLESFKLKSCCREIVIALADTSNYELAAVSNQKYSIWWQERRLRITGSRCYSIYTYQQSDWESKNRNYFWPKKISNKYIEHGNKYEKHALEKYKQANKYDVCEMGLIICKNYPWLAYSPDGIVMSNGMPCRLVEIKCPYDGIDKDAIDLISCCPYLQLSLEGGIQLKKKHSYFGQVQLGMAILNLKICDFLIYSSKSESFLNILVSFDEHFTRDMIYIISNKYFKYMLHTVCEKNAKENNFL